MKKVSLFVGLACFAAVLAGCNNSSKCCAVNSSFKTDVIAHRGSSAMAPENTLSSVKLAWEQDADGAEIDVHLTKDKRIVVMHDYSTKRTSGVDMKIYKTDSEELRKLDVGKFKGEKFVGEKIPFVEEVLATIPQGKKLFVEIKSSPEILPYLEEAIDQSGKRDQVVIIAFSLQTMIESKIVMPDIPAYWLHSAMYDHKNNRLIPYDENLIKICKQNNIDGLDLAYGGFTPEFVQKAKEANIGLYVWTVDGLDVAQQMLDYQVAGITTNVPQTLKDEFKI